MYTRPVFSLLFFACKILRDLYIFGHARSLACHAQNLVCLKSSMSYMIFARRRLSSGVASTFDGQTTPGLAPATTRQMLCFLHFRDQGPALGVPGVSWLLLEPHRLHMNGRRANKFGGDSPLGRILGPILGPEARTLSTSCAKSSMIYIFLAFRVHLHAMLRIMPV